MTNNSVLQDWVTELPFQQQSVLMCALRGPDGIYKYHPMKTIVRAYRASIIKAAFGRALTADDISDTFMDFGIVSSNDFYSGTPWQDAVALYYDHVDELPHHYHLHMLHGAQIAGYNHPDQLVRGRWLNFYKLGVDDMHLFFENRTRMNTRLNDFGHSLDGKNGHKEN